MRGQEWTSPAPPAPLIAFGGGTGVGHGLGQAWACPSSPLSSPPTAASSRWTPLRKGARWCASCCLSAGIRSESTTESSRPLRRRTSAGVMRGHLVVVVRSPSRTSGVPCGITAAAVRFTANRQLVLRILIVPMVNIEPIMRNRLPAADSPCALTTARSGWSARRRIKGPRRVRTIPLAVLFVGIVPLILAACGSSSASGANASSTKPSGRASRTAYSNCLKQHGVTLPNFTGGTGGPPAGGETPPSFTPGSGAGGFRSNPAFQKAATACKSLRPSGGFGGFGGSGGFNSSAFAAYRNCLSLHGVTLPTGGSRPAAGSTPPSTINQSSPAVQAALQACAALRPSASSSTTTTTG